MFITFEGPEGSGKSTQISLLSAYLRGQGFDVLETREPGGTLIGDQIRACVHDIGNREITAEAELLLYSASRAQLVTEVIRPAVAAGRVVLCDRFADSSMAYQGYGRGLDLGQLAQITDFATGGLKPDLTLLLDIDVARGLSRRMESGGEMNRLDLETLSFHQRVQKGYHELAKADPDRWVVFDAEREVSAVQADMQKIVLNRLRKARLKGKA